METLQPIPLKDHFTFLYFIFFSFVVLKLVDSSHPSAWLWNRWSGRMRWISKIRNVNIWMMEKDHKRCQTRWEKNDIMCFLFGPRHRINWFLLLHTTWEWNRTFSFLMFIFVPDNLLDADITFFYCTDNPVKNHISYLLVVDFRGFSTHYSEEDTDVTHRKPVSAPTHTSW